MLKRRLIQTSYSSTSAMSTGGTHAPLPIGIPVNEQSGTLKYIDRMCQPDYCRKKSKGEGWLQERWRGERTEGDGKACETRKRREKGKDPSFCVCRVFLGTGKPARLRPEPFFYLLWGLTGRMRQTQTGSSNCKKVLTEQKCPGVFIFLFTFLFFFNRKLILNIPCTESRKKEQRKKKKKKFSFFSLSGIGLRRREEKTLVTRKDCE